MLGTSYKVMIHIFLPLFIGGLIYVGFRSKSLLIYSWVDNVSLNNLIIDFRNLLKSYQLQNWIKYSLPDGLWTYSLTSSLCLLLKKRYQLYWFVLPFILSIGFELFQMFKIIRGTFDIIDLVVCFIAYLLSILFFKPYKYEKNNN